ncbi:MAG: prenyltransferase/squalene oxidase repeat-containing protein [Planctomycetota bacterium]
MLQRWIALSLIAMTVAAADDFAPFSPVEGWEKQGLAAGGEGAENAARASFEWLASQQREDGSWASPEGEHDVATTALVALAFLGEGHTHRFGEHKRTVNGALRYLRARKAPEGKLGWLDAAVRCWALAEAYAVSRDFTLKPHVEGARDALLALRGADGGWGNGPDAASNTLAKPRPTACSR